jgi:hypothetical protein
MSNNVPLFVIGLPKDEGEFIKYVDNRQRESIRKMEAN